MEFRSIIDFATILFPLLNPHWVPKLSFDGLRGVVDTAWHKGEIPITLSEILFYITRLICGVRETYIDSIQGRFMPVDSQTISYNSISSHNFLSIFHNALLIDQYLCLSSNILFSCIDQESSSQLDILSKRQIINIMLEMNKDECWKHECRIDSQGPRTKAEIRY